MMELDDRIKNILLVCSILAILLGLYMAFIYAPYADASVQPNNDFYGGVWANNVEISPDIDFYVDLDLVDGFPADSVRIVSRKEIRDMDYLY